MQRVTFLKLTAAGIVTPVVVPDVASAQFGNIVYDPANYAAMLRQLSNDFIHNKNELMMINLLLQQWSILSTQHKLNIGQVWSSISPTISALMSNLAKNDVISQTTLDIYTAISKAFPAFTLTSSSIPILIQQYRQYMQQSAANVLTANNATQQSITTQAGAIDAIQARAKAAQSDTDRFEISLEMSAATAQGIGMLHTSITGLVGLYARYIESEAARQQTTQDSGRYIFAQQMLGQTSNQLQTLGPPATISSYLRNPPQPPVIPQ
jgi:hypothetical protein